MNRIASRRRASDRASRSASDPDAASPSRVPDFKPVDPDLFEFDDLQPPEGRPTRGNVDVETGHLTFHGGKVLASPDVVPVYVGAYWRRRSGQARPGSERRGDGGTGEGPGPDRALEGVRRRSWDDVGVEGPAGGRKASGSPRRTSRHWSQPRCVGGTFDTSDPERVFTLVLPPGAVLEDGGASSEHGLGGFHGNVETADGRTVYYAVVVYSQRTADGVNGIDFTGKPIDNVTITESHEITEVVTDPDVGKAIETGDPGFLAWYDDTTPILRRDGSPVLDDWGRPMRGKGEIGDIPILNAELEGDEDLSSVWGRVEGFAFQTEWSNADGKAELAPERGLRPGASVDRPGSAWRAFRQQGMRLPASPARRRRR